MGLIYNRGDIIFINNVELYNYDGTKSLDTRIKGHPFIILNDIDDLEEDILCLKVSSSKLGKRKNTFYIIDNFKLYGEKTKRSFVDIKHIYKMKIDKVHQLQGCISSHEMKDLSEYVQKYL